MSFDRQCHLKVESCLWVTIFWGNISCSKTFCVYSYHMNTWAVLLQASISEAFLFLRLSSLDQTTAITLQKVKAFEMVYLTLLSALHSHLPSVVSPSISDSRVLSAHS